MKSSPAFSLPEVLILVTTVAILFVVASPYLYSKSDYAKVGKAQIRLLRIESALQAHVEDWGSVPADLNDSYETTLAYRVRSAKKPVCSFGRSNLRKSGVITFVGGVDALGEYDPGVYCPLTSPAEYLDSENLIDPFGDGTFQMGYDSMAVSAVGRDDLPKDTITYGAGFSAGPDRVAGDWYWGNPSGPIGGALAFSPSNGIRSRGEMWVIVPNPTATNPIPGVLDESMSWKHRYNALRSFSNGDE